MGRDSVKRRLAGVLGGPLLVLLAGCGGQQWVEVEGSAMGMRWRFQVADVRAEDVRAAATSCLERWEKATSLWRADSELVQFNQALAGTWIQASDELWTAVMLAREVAGETVGALDITVRPLVELWGFGAVASDNASRPSEEEIKAAQANCQWRHLDVDPAWQRMKKAAPGVRLDVNCVVEGLVLDELAAWLRAQGCRDFLLELGGELLAAGQSRQGGPWVAGVQSPDGESGDLMTSMPLRDEALATSGTYRHRREQDGRTISHLIDPRSGRPVEHRLVSVSVVHPSCARADAYATALLVLGPVQGRAVADQLGLRAFWIEAVE